MDKNSPYCFRVAHRWLLALLMLAPLAGQCADDLLTSQMVDEARVWQTKGRNDLAADLWRRILVSSPQHGEALTSLGLIALRQGNSEEARLLYQRAQRVPSPPKNLARLAQALATDGDKVPSAQASVSKRAAEVNPKDPSSAVRPAPRAATEPPPTASSNKRASVAVLDKTNSLPVAQAPVPPPSTEVRVTPLPLNPMVVARTLPSPDGTGDPEVELKATSTMQGMTANPKPVSGTSTGSSLPRKPRPCRLPVGNNSPPPVTH